MWRTTSIDTEKLGALAVAGVLALAGPFAGTVSAHGRAPAERVSVTLTSADLHRALSPMPVRRFGRIRRGIRTIWISEGTRYQQVIGFGAAMTDTSAWLLWNKLPAARRRRVMKALFGVGGIALNYVRLPMGASDFTVTGIPYTYDDMPAGRTDPKLVHFSIAHDETYILPALRQMLRISRATDILASPWSAPEWMKANDALDNLGYAGALLRADYRPFAEYFVRFIEAYARAGVPVTAVTPMNEGGTPSLGPGTSLNEPRLMLRYLVPALRAAGLDTRVYSLDGSGFAGEEKWLASRSYRATIAGTAVHCYAGLEQMSELHTLDPRGSLIMSECSPNHTAYPTSEIGIVSLRNYAQAVELWNLALDPEGGPKEQIPGCDRCGALVTINERTHRAKLSLNYYQLGQLSRFVRRGAVRIASTRWVSDWSDLSTGAYGVTPGLDNVALRNPNGSIVLVAYDNAPQPIRFQVAWRGRAFTYRLPAGATVTFTWQQ